MQRICKEWNHIPVTTYFLVTTLKANLINKKLLLGLAASTLALLEDPHLPTHSYIIFPEESFHIPVIYILVVRCDLQSTIWSYSVLEY